MADQERYRPVVLTANQTYKMPSGSPTGIGIFMAVTAGTITVTDKDGVVVLNAFPVAAGQYYYMPFYTGPEGTVVLAGGASGTLGLQ